MFFNIFFTGFNTQSGFYENQQERKGYSSWLTHEERKDSHTKSLGSKNVN